jgi:hypothetical protein
MRNMRLLKAEMAAQGTTLERWCAERGVDPKMVEVVVETGKRVPEVEMELREAFGRWPVTEVTAA